MKKQLSIIIIASLVSCGVCFSSWGQTLYVPSGTSGIGTSTTGNVGIGTGATPSSLLTVQGTGALGSTFQQKITNGSQTLVFGANVTAAEVQSQGAVPLYLNYGGNNIIMNATGGNVGIGSSTTPSSRLTIQGTGALGSTFQQKITNGSQTLVFGVNGTAAEVQSQGAVPLYLNYSGNNVIMNATGGNVGIGTATPADQLEVVSSNRKVGLNTAISGVTNGGVLSLSRGDDGTKVMYFGTSAAPTDDPVIYGSGGATEMRFVSGGGTGAGFGFYSNISSTNAFASSRPTPVLKIDGSGNVGIGNASPDAKLAVSGQVHAQEVKVSVTVPGPDYVFDKNYKLLTLEEVKTYIDQNKHLPEVPSAAAMEKNGVQLGEMNMLLLKKVEELTLYILDQEKRIKSLEEEKLHTTQTKN